MNKRKMKIITILLMLTTVIYIGLMSYASYGVYMSPYAELSAIIEALYGAILFPYMYLLLLCLKMISTFTLEGCNNFRQKTIEMIAFVILVLIVIANPMIILIIHNINDNLLPFILNIVEYGYLLCMLLLIFLRHIYSYDNKSQNRANIVFEVIYVVMLLLSLIYIVTSLINIGTLVIAFGVNYLVIASLNMANELTFIKKMEGKIKIKEFIFSSLPIISCTCSIVVLIFEGYEYDLPYNINFILVSYSFAKIFVFVLINIPLVVKIVYDAKLNLKYLKKQPDCDLISE